MGALKLDMHNKCVFKNNIDLCLSQKEYDLLKLFMTNPGRNYTRIELLDRIWGEHFEGLEHTVNTTINRIRMKIEDDLKSPQYIITTWGIGYKFNTPKDVHTPS